MENIIKNNGLNKFKAAKSKEANWLHLANDNLLLTRVTLYIIRLNIFVIVCLFQEKLSHFKIARMIIVSETHGPKLTRSLSHEEEDGEPVSSAR